MAITYSGLYNKFIDLIETYCFNVNSSGGYKPIPSGFTNSKSVSTTSGEHTAAVTLSYPQSFTTSAVRQNLKPLFTLRGIDVDSAASRTPKEAAYFINAMAEIMWNCIRVQAAYFSSQNWISESDGLRFLNKNVYLQPFYYLGSIQIGTEYDPIKHVERNDIDSVYELLNKRFTNSGAPDLPTGGNFSVSFTSCSSSSSCSSSCSSSSCSSSSSSSSCSSIFIAYFNLP